MTIARVFRVGLVETTATVCRCGHAIEPRDFERVGRAVRVICPKCHVDLIRIDLQREDDEISA
jgi:hypothetical protein